MKNHINILSLLCFVIFLDSLGNFMTLPVLFRITHEYQQLFFEYLPEQSKNTFFYLSLVASSLSGILLAPFFGKLSDIFGRKKMILFSLFINIFAYSVFIVGIYTKSFLIILLGKSLTGVASNSQPIAEASVNDLSSQFEKSSYYIGLIAFSLIMAMVIGPILGAYLTHLKNIPWFNLYIPLIIGLSLSSVAIFLMLSYYQETNALNNSNVRLANTLKEIKLNKKVLVPILPLFCVFFFLQFSWAMFYQFMPVFLHDKYHFSINQTSVFLSLLSLIMGFGILTIYYFIIKICSLEKIIIGCIFIAFLSLLSFSLSTSLYLFGSVYALVIGLYYPALVTSMTQTLTKNQCGWLMGVNTGLMNAAWLLSSMVLMIFSVASDVINLAIGLFSIFCAILSYYYALLMRKRHRSLPLSRGCE